MNGYYAGKIKVVGEDLLCFRVDATTMDPLGGGSFYDPWAWSDPDPEPVETISVGEWKDRRKIIWDAKYRST